ncbi:cysteine-rich secretory protein [Metarhizium robertsii]|uniref:Cysteine-rich secretory protein n=1 Tax=Metarhizium robertsii TaxID=568076 RepID=A0A0A1UZR4_9HYPO|nr:cysteine-rich secretory protein [Metarhizium robertsii]
MKIFVGSLISCLLAQSGLAIAGSNDPSMALALVNQARQGKGLQPLSWDANLEAYAQFWANQMGSGMQPFEHSPVSYRPSQGENLYEQSAGQCDADYDSPIVAAMRAWLSQERLYTGQPITTGKEPWLHWSQCMWSTTTRIGCARAYSISEPYKFFDVCRFAPEGNMLSVGQKPF